MLLRARAGTFLTFLLAGLLCGVWTARMPALAAKFHADEGAVGVVVLVWGLGALAAMQGLRTVLGRFGSRAVLRVSLPLTALSYLGVAFAPDYAALLVAVGVFGMAFGVTDVSMNAQGSVVEQAYGRSVMSGMHAGWCVGAMSGGLLGVATAAAGLGFTPTVLVAALAALPAGIALGPTYLPDRAASRAASRRRTRMPLAVYIIGGLAFIAFMTEGSIADWSGLFLHDELGTTQAVAALGYPMFELAMLFGRLVGDRLRMRLGTRRLLAWAGFGTAAAMTVVVTAPSAPVAIGGFFVTGLVICTVVPTTISLAGSAAPDAPAAAVAQVGAMGYGGLLLGPVVIGFLSQATSLRFGVGVAVLLALVVGFGARYVPLGGRRDVAAREPLPVPEPEAGTVAA